MYKLRRRTPAITVGGQAEELYLPIQGGYRLLRQKMSLPLFSGVLAVTGFHAIWTEHRRPQDGLLKAVECMDTERPPRSTNVEVVLVVVVVVAEMTYAPVTRREDAIPTANRTSSSPLPVQVDARHR